MRIFLAAIASIVLASSASAQPTYTFEITSDPVLIDPTAVVSNLDVAMVCDTPGTPTGGLQLCFAYDPDQISVFGILDQAADPQTGPAFFVPFFTNEPTVIDGFTYGPGVGYVAALWDFNPANFPTFDLLTTVLRFQVYSGPVATPGISTVQFIGNGVLDLPGLFTTVNEVAYTDDTGQTASYNPPDFPAPVTLVSGPQFARGDANGDGSVNLVDAIRVLEWGFIAGSSPVPCEAAIDFDADGDNAPLPSTIQILDYLFAGGSLPPDGVGCGTRDPLGLPCSFTGCP